jgi:acyl carrier protein
MSEATLLPRLNEVFRSVFDDPALTVSLATTAKDVPGWDSIVHITLVIEVERTFSVKFGMAEIEKLRNVGDLATILAAKQAHA